MNHDGEYYHGDTELLITSSCNHSTTYNESKRVEMKKIAQEVSYKGSCTCMFKVQKLDQPCHCRH